MRRLRILLLLLVFSFCLFGCGDSAGKKAEAAKPATEKSKGSFKAAKFAGASFDKSSAGGSNGVKIDLSSVKKGYVGVSAKASKRLKFQVIKGGDTYTYDISSKGKPSIFPLQLGNGRYVFKVMRNVSSNRYVKIYETSKTVKLANGFQPFLRPSDYVNYSKKSKCVQKAAEFAKSSTDSNDFVLKVYEYISANVTYDRDKASNVTTGYLPVPDETFETGKGICFDYASLAASMLRSQGIPTKVIFGYVSPDDLYHAWNMFYTKESGWITVEMKVEKKKWYRLDLTFSANGTDADFIGNGENYTDVYFY